MGIHRINSPRKIDRTERHLRIVEALSTKSMTTKQLAFEYKMDRSTICKDLLELEELCLVQRVKSFGKTIFWETIKYE